MPEMNEMNYSGQVLLTETVDVPDNTVVHLDDDCEISCDQNMTGPIFTVYGRDTVIFTGAGRIAGKLNDSLRDDIEQRRTNGDPVPEEHWHGIDIRNSNRVIVAGLTIANTCGDGVYIGPVDSAGDGSMHINVTRVSCDGVGRCGVCVVSGTMVPLDSISTTGRGLSYGNKGILLEPSDMGDWMNYVNVFNCVAVSPRSHGIHVQMKRGGPINAYLSSCRYVGNGYATRATCPVDRASQVTGQLTFAGCRGRHWDEWAATAPLIRV
jgi:hypothetical protein